VPKLHAACAPIIINCAIYLLQSFISRSPRRG
jgi:hypothetical protein